VEKSVLLLGILESYTCDAMLREGRGGRREGLRGRGGREGREGGERGEGRERGRGREEGNGEGEGGVGREEWGGRRRGGGRRVEIRGAQEQEEGRRVGEKGKRGEGDV
jgi:hypothetical protein